MYTPKWRIGIDLYRNKIQLVAAKQRRKHWSLCECWQHHLSTNLDEKPEHEQHIILLEILKKWRQKLPKNCTVSIALPSLRTLKQQFSLSTQMNLQQPELEWYLQTRAEKLFPMHAEELILDYRVIESNVYLNGARKSDVTFWQQLLAESGFNLSAIDVAPIALRYVAKYANLPDECWLVHYRQGEWLWSGPLSQPANYNHIQDNEITTLSQLIPLLGNEESIPTLPIYYISDHPQSDTQNQWDLRQAFHQYPIKLPHLLGDFVIAAGLALRHGDI